LRFSRRFSGQTQVIIGDVTGRAMCASAGAAADATPFDARVSNAGWTHHNQPTRWR
jgi:hypothetical protein